MFERLRHLERYKKKKVRKENNEIDSGNVYANAAATKRKRKRAVYIREAKSFFVVVDGCRNQSIRSWFEKTAVAKKKYKSRFKERGKRQANTFCYKGSLIGCDSQT